MNLDIQEEVLPNIPLASELRSEFVAQDFRKIIHLMARDIIEDMAVKKSTSYTLAGFEAPQSWRSYYLNVRQNDEEPGNTLVVAEFYHKSVSIGYREREYSLDKYRNPLQKYLEDRYGCTREYRKLENTYGTCDMHNNSFGCYYDIDDQRLQEIQKQRNFLDFIICDEIEKVLLKHGYTVENTLAIERKKNTKLTCEITGGLKISVT